MVISIESSINGILSRRQLIMLTVKDGKSLVYNCVFNSCRKFQLHVGAAEGFRVLILGPIFLTVSCAMPDA